MTELENIPPLWTGVFQWGAVMVYLLTLPKKHTGPRYWCCAFGLLPVLLFAMGLVGAMNGLRFNIGMALVAVLTLAPFAALAAVPLSTAAYTCARAYIYGAFAASLLWQLNIYWFKNQPLAELAVMSLGGILFGLVMHWLERQHAEELRKMTIPPKSCGFTLVCSLVIYILSSISYAPIRTPFGGTTQADAFNLRSMVYLGGVAILYAYHTQLCEQYARQEVGVLQEMMEMQHANYRQSEETVELINRKYHDLKHQIAALRAELGSGQSAEYLDRMEREIRAYEAENKTGNKVLDTILTSKGLHCQTCGIQLRVIADGAALDFMDVMDLSALFGNALDNAIEAVAQVPDPEQRLIRLLIARQRGFLTVQVENTYAAAVQLRDGMPVTTKSDRRFHGYGVKSIFATAEKYGGTAAIETKDGLFRLRILIPIPEKAL